MDPDFFFMGALPPRVRQSFFALPHECIVPPDTGPMGTLASGWIRDRFL